MTTPAEMFARQLAQMTCIGCGDYLPDLTTPEPKWIIRDWAGNDCFDGQTFATFDDAEEFLTEQLGDEYETDRGEYEVQPK